MHFVANTGGVLAGYRGHRLSFAPLALAWPAAAKERKKEKTKNVKRKGKLEKATFFFHLRPAAISLRNEEIISA